jgi:hypothetical protein
MIYCALRVRRRLDGRAPPGRFLHYRYIHGVQLMRILDAAGIKWGVRLRPEQSESSANR